MNFADSIKKARERGISDDQILEAIIKQNPHKEDFFNQEKEKGFSSAQILDNIINQESSFVSSQATQEEARETEEKPEEKKISFDEKLSPEIFAKIPSKPSEETKVWVRVGVTLALSAIAAFSFTLFYRVFFVPTLAPIDPVIVEKELQIPRISPPLINLHPEKDNIRRFAISVDDEYKVNLRRIVREEDEGEIVRIIAEDHREGARNARLIDLQDFFTIFEIEFHERDFEEFFEKIEKDFDLFVYTGEPTNRIGFVSKFTSNAQDKEDVEYNVMRRWEERTMAENFEEFFGFWGEEIDPDGSFGRTSFQGEEMPVSFDIRYLEGTGGMGIYYSLSEGRLLFSTSLESIQVMIERYYEL